MSASPAPASQEPPPEPRKRLTLSEIVEALLQRGGREHSSVTLTRNAKGETQIEVVVRTGESPEVESIEDAETKAMDVFERLRARYPMRDGFVGSPIHDASGVLAQPGGDDAPA